MPPRLRFTIRGLMIVVAVTGALVAVYPLYRRSEAFRLRARLEGVFASLGEDGGHPAGRARPEWVAYHRSLQLKYERLTHYPWLYAEADPPEPPAQPYSK